MRALLLSSEFPPGPGGIGRHCHQLLQGLARLGHEILVLAPQDYASEEEAREFNGRQPFEVRTLHHSTPSILEGVFRYRALREAALSWEPDVVVATGERSVWLSAALRSKPCARVAIGHGSEFTVRSRWRRALTRWSFSRVDFVICVSEFTRSRMRSLGIRPSRDSVIPNGGDPSLFRSLGEADAMDFRRHLGIDGHMLLTVGNLTARKGQDLVISALPHISEELGKVHYVCVGIPSEKTRLEALAERLGVFDQVHILGRMDDRDLVRAYNACDVFMMTSRPTQEGDVEGFGIAVIEAALCGKPAIVTEGSGLTEAIDPGETGLTARPEEPADIAGKVTRLLSDKGLRLRLGKRARERAIGTHTWESTVEVYERVLEETISRQQFRDDPAELGRLVIVSHTPHYPAGGGIVGWGPTVREIDHLAHLFEAIVHIAPLYDEAAPASALPYTSQRVSLHAVRPSGGEHLRDKLGILLQSPSYILAVRRELKEADIVHVRCPSNIGLLTLLLLTVTRRPSRRWIKYAGNWNPPGSEPLSYRLQRWWLTRNLVRGVVTVNGRWPNQPSHIRAFMNPCLTDSELAEARNAAAKELSEPIKLLFVGRVEEAKGIRVVVEVAAELHEQGVTFSLDVVGDGPARAQYQAWLDEHGLADIVCWHGWKPRPELNSYYRSAHLLLAPSHASEGWPKIIGEAMAFGVVPLAGDISTIPQVLKDSGTGMVLSRRDASGYVSAIKGYLSNRDRWHRESKSAASAASFFTYGRYLDEVQSLVGRKAK